MRRIENLGKLEIRDRKHMVELGVLAAYQANLEREAKKIYGEEGEEIDGLGVPIYVMSVMSCQTESPRVPHFQGKIGWQAPEPQLFPNILTL